MSCDHRFAIWNVGELCRWRMQMPIRRSVLSAIGLLVFGAAVLRGQQHDPFAEWDRQNPRPTAKKTTSRAPKTDVKYFSPKSEEEASSEDDQADTPDNKAFEVARQRMRQRIQTGPADRGTTPKSTPPNKPATSTNSLGKNKDTAPSAATTSTSKGSAKPPRTADQPVAE